MQNHNKLKFSFYHFKSCSLIFTTCKIGADYGLNRVITARNSSQLMKEISMFFLCTLLEKLSLTDLIAKSLQEN
jgi:hypothetical protein